MPVSLLFQLGSFHYLSSLLAAASTSEIMLSKSGDRGHPWDFHIKWSQKKRDITPLMWKYNFFNWRIISLQNFVVFCQSSTWISHAAAAAKSLQSCPTLCDPMDGSPPGSPIPGILQARPLEWVAISFSNAWKWKVKVKSLSRVRLLATPWTAAHQAPPSMGFSRQEYWSGVPLPSPFRTMSYC